MKQKTNEYELIKYYSRFSSDNPPNGGFNEMLLVVSQDDDRWWDFLDLYLSTNKISVDEYVRLLRKTFVENVHGVGMLFDEIFGSKTQDPNDIWEALVLLVGDNTSNLTTIRHGLRKCKDHFNEDTLGLVYSIANTKQSDTLTSRIASVLPDDIRILTQWLSLCERQKRNVGLCLYENAGNVDYSNPRRVEFYEEKLNDTFMQEPSDLVGAWLDLCRSMFYRKIARHYSSADGFLPQAFPIAENFILGFETWSKKLDKKSLWKSVLHKNIYQTRSYLKKLKSHMDASEEGEKVVFEI